MFTQNRRCGFTLVELLVVMAIIMSLAGMLVGGLHAVRAMGYGVSCQANLRAISSAFEVYRTEYDGWMPYCLDPVPAVEQTADKGRAIRWKYALSYYIGNHNSKERAQKSYPLSKAFFDPIAGQGKGNYFLSLKQFGAKMRVLQRIQGSEEEQWMDFAEWTDGYRLNDKGERVWEARSEVVPYGHMKYDTWKEPSRAGIVTECTDPKLHRSMARDTKKIVKVEYRHKGKANVLFLDGHVEEFAQGNEMLFKLFDEKIMETSTRTKQCDNINDY